MPGGQPVPAPGGQPTPTPTPQPSGPGSSYLTVAPALKAMLDRLDNSEKPALVVIVAKGQSKLAKELGRRLLSVV